ncbi:hypothetical protein PUN28_008301 [Cardiocondyla obscurior]|uniref:Uncharacterized protein n=1 Tax=Cardiocondyla obscurior TaxID=286306 RepID=A0AAW2G011_9HYME
MSNSQRSVKRYPKAADRIRKACPYNLQSSSVRKLILEDERKAARAKDRESGSNECRTVCSTNTKECCKTLHIESPTRASDSVINRRDSISLRSPRPRLISTKVSRVHRWTRHALGSYLRSDGTTNDGRPCHHETGIHPHVENSS